MADEKRIDLADVQDPNFCGGLDPVTYLDQFRDGELRDCDIAGCLNFAGHRGDHRFPPSIALPTGGGERNDG